MSKRSESEKNEAIEHLRKILKPGDKVYSIIRSVSKSGMSRRIDFYAVVGGDMRFLTGWIADINGQRLHRQRQGLLANGCGMDMCFATVYNLGRALFPDHNRSNGGTDGGYSLESVIL